MTKSRLNQIKPDQYCCLLKQRYIESPAVLSAHTVLQGQEAQLCLLSMLYIYIYNHIPVSIYNPNCIIKDISSTVEEIPWGQL